MSSSGEGNDDWCTIESDPGVFTALLESLGCTTVELQELWSLDDDTLQKDTIYGLIFLFQYDTEAHKNATTSKEPLSADAMPEDLFFAHQVTTNACATQAILSVVLNANLTEDELGKTLSEFKTFTASFPPDLKGVAIASSPEIKQIHNSFARQDAFLQEIKTHKALPTDENEAFHFVAYVPVHDVVYELDGLQSGPVVVGTKTDEKEPWWIVAKQAIQERMATENHVKFNLMAVTKDQRIALQGQLDALDASSDEYHQVMHALDAQEAKRQQWKLENERRQHNYVPLCMQMLHELARAGQLPALIQQAQEKRAAVKSAKQEGKQGD